LAGSWTYLGRSEGKTNIAVGESIRGQGSFRIHSYLEVWSKGFSKASQSSEGEFLISLSFAIFIKPAGIQKTRTIESYDRAIYIGTSVVEINF
jgi:hypothetical protein